MAASSLTKLPKGKKSEKDEIPLRKQPDKHASSDSQMDLLSLQRRVGNEAVSQLLRQTADNSATETDDAPPIIENAFGGDHGQSLAPSTRDFMESRFGYDFGQVRVHADAHASELARTIGAKAYTVGQDITFGQGRYKPETTSGKQLLAHELTHVIQQSGHPSYSSSRADLEGEAQAVGVSILANQPVSVQGSIPGPTIQMVPEEKIKLPAAVVTSPSAEIFKEPNADALKQDTLKRNDLVEKIIEKRKIGADWWDKIRYTVNKANKVGWTLGSNLSEIASPETFKFMTPGATGVTSPYQKIREKMSEERSLEPHIARLINLMNINILPSPGLTLPDFVGKSFYAALVAAKGNFKRASLLMVGAARAFKPSSGGSFPWVQAKTDPSRSFDPATFRDKIWHFFWNAYESFDGTSAGWLDMKGVAYELKSRSEPIKKLIRFKPLSRGAREDILFNRGGIAFAEWVMKNYKMVIKHHYSQFEKSFMEVIAGDPKLSKLPGHQIDAIIRKALERPEAETELRKRCYMDFAEYAAKHIKLVLDAVKKIPANVK